MMAFGYENELKAEIERLRNQLEEAVGKAAWHYENLTLLEEKMVERNAEIDRLRLTDAERADLHWFAHYGLPEHRAATLRSLLERLA